MKQFQKWPSLKNGGIWGYFMHLYTGLPPGGGGMPPLSLYTWSVYPQLQLMPYPARMAG